MASYPVQSNKLSESDIDDPSILIIHKIYFEGLTVQLEYFDPLMFR